MSDENDEEVHRIPKCMWEGKLRVLRELGEGAHGDVVLVQDCEFKVFAAKTVPIQSNAAYLLAREYEIYKHIGCVGRKVKGFPQIYSFGADPSHAKYVLIMNRLGAALRDVQKMNDGILPKYSVMRIGYQVLRRLEYMHRKGVVHGDIKPRNILCHLENFQKIYIVDFGLATFYKDQKMGKHRRMTTDNRFQGTEEFASRHVHNGCSLSRRDDIESLGYTLIFLMKGKLPWSENQEVSEITEPLDEAKILAMKESTSVEELCDGLPSGIEEYMRYVYDMHFYEEPDYSFLIEVLMMGMKQLEEQGNLDDGDKLDIWPNADEKETFMGHRNEDALWNEFLHSRSGNRNTTGDATLESENDEETANRQDRSQQNVHDERMQTTSELLHQPYAGGESVADEVTTTCNLFHLIRSFTSWKSLTSQNNGDELSKVSTAQPEPLIWSREFERKCSLIKRFFHIFKSGPDDLQEIFLCYEQDSWSESSAHDLW